MNRTEFSQKIRHLMILLVRGYQLLISPFLGNNCRFYPTCSAYTIEAMETHGVFKGLYLGIRRLLRCHPYHQGGIDLVPPAKGDCCKDPDKPQSPGSDRG